MEDIKERLEMFMGRQWILRTEEAKAVLQGEQVPIGGKHVYGKIRDCEKFTRFS